MAAPELSAIVLCYRAEGSIRRVVDPLHALLEESGVPYELVLVANYREGSDDTTPAVVEEFARTHPNVRFLANAKRGGMGEDMRAGFAAAQGDNLVVIDGDAQNPVEDLLKMHQLMQETGADVMKGRRIARFDGPYRRVVSGGFNTMFMILFGSRGLWDINGKPKGLSRRAYERMTLKSDDWFIDAEIVLAARRLGLEVVEMPVVFRRNEERASFVKFSAIWEFLGNMARARLGRPR
jgi:glycosyltransferase involved in cell wall biosynthesis